MKKTKYLENNREQDCYGCGICEWVCPTQAIKMQEDHRGFVYPVVSNTECIQCGKCHKACPVEMEKLGTKGTIYQLAHKSREVCLASQSGGAFTALSDVILQRKGVVYGAAFAKDFTVVHKRAETKEQRSAMHGSKYVQSRITKKILKQLEKDIRDERDILFTGTPCQCAMIAKNYGGYDKIIICDFICHGVPSPYVWKENLSYMEKKYHMEIRKAVFRNKRCRGKGNNTESYYSWDGNEIFSNEYSALYYSHLAHRKSCFSCQFAKQERYADITIGGFLEPSDFKAEYDSSMVIVNSEKGRWMFEQIADAVRWQESRLEFYKNQPCLYHAIPYPENYDVFWKCFQEEGIEEVVEKFATDDIKHRFHLEIL